MKQDNFFREEATESLQKWTGGLCCSSSLLSRTYWAPGLLSFPYMPHLPLVAFPPPHPQHLQFGVRYCSDWKIGSYCNHQQSRGNSDYRRQPGIKAISAVSFFFSCHERKPQRCWRLVSVTHGPPSCLLGINKEGRQMSNTHINATSQMAKCLYLLLNLLHFAATM